MNKYIDADELIAEIERRIAQWQPYTFACASQIASEAFDRIDELKGLLIYITSLQQEQPESELEKVARHVYKSWMGGTMNGVRNDMVELGKVLNARKEE